MRIPTEYLRKAGGPRMSAERPPQDTGKRAHAPIHALIVSFLLDDFGSQVIRSPTQSVRQVRHVFREPKVRHFDVPVRSDEDVFGLQVTVDDVD